MHDRRPLPTLLVTLAALATPSWAWGAEDLREIVPGNAWMLVHTEQDPDMAFVDEATRELFQAIEDAEFDEFALEFLAAAGQPPEAINELRGVFTIVSHLLAQVPWAALVEKEFVFAMLEGSPFPELTGMPSMLVVCRPDRERMAEVEKSLLGLMSAVSSIHDAIVLDTNERTGADTRIYGLRYAPAPIPMPIIQMAFRDDQVVFGFGEDAFRDAVTLLEGRAGRNLVDSERYAASFGELDPDARHTFYMDLTLMLEGMRGQVLRQMQGDYMARAAVNDVWTLFSDLGTVSSTMRAEGLTVIEETWTRSDADPSTSKNPCIVAFTPEPNADLLDYVPVDAYSYALYGGVDLTPIYHWFLSRIGDYVPEANDSLLAWEAMQELADLRIDDDLLSWLGSENVTITMPARQPTATHSEDWIHIARLRDPKGARKVAGRLEGVFNTVVPKLMKRIQQQIGNNPWLPKIEIGPAEGDFPMLSRMTVNVGSLPVADLTFGFIGNLLIVTSSDASLEYVLGVAAGEYPSIFENPQLAAGTDLPPGPVVAATLVPNARNHEKAMQELAQLGPAMDFGLGMALGPGAAKDPRIKAMKAAVSGCMTRMTAVLQQADFLKYTTTWTELREGGTASYTRTNMVYKSVEERALARR